MALNRQYELVSGVVSERVGRDVIVLLPDSKESFRLSGEWAEAFTAVEQGTNRAVVSDQVLGDLVRQGLLSECPKRQLSRRSVLSASATGLGAGVFALSLPAVAAASSGIPVSGTYQPGLNLGDGPGVEIVVLGFDFPNSLGDGVAGDPNPPSSLSISGFGTPIPASAWASSGDADFDGVAWFLLQDPAPGIFSGTITGRFTWGGTAYVATLTRL